MSNEQNELSLNDAMDATMQGVVANMAKDDAGSTDAAAAPAAEEQQPATEAKPSRARDESGRFAAKPAEEARPAKEQAAAEEEQPPAVAAKPAPGSWPKELKEKFGALPAEVQEYVHRRESDISRTINQYSQKAKFADSITQALAPHEATLRAVGADPVSAVSGLMNTLHILRNAPPAQKAQAVAQMIKNFGVDLSLLNEDGNAGNSARHSDELYTRLGQLEQELARRQAADEQSAQTHVESEIARFAEGKPHFDAVRQHMGALMQAGLAKDMDDAYDQACMANPEIRATLLQEQETKRREEAAAKAAAARKAAAVNVTQRGIPPAAKPLGTMEDTMRETFRRLNG